MSRLDNTRELIKRHGLKVDQQWYKDVTTHQFIVLSSRNELNPKKFDCAVLAQTLEDAKLIVRWNYTFFASIVDLETVTIIEEVSRIVRPTILDIL